METEKLFQQDAFLREFTAKVVEVTSHQNKPALLLDRTAFYPTSGGQPNDTGKINDVQVVDVIEVGHTVLHILEKELPSDVTTNTEVRGVIDWDRRLDHMQQHHGQHILSQAFLSVANAQTLAFHLGKEVSDIDLDTTTLSESDVLRVQELANRVVQENRPVKVTYHTVEEARALAMRKPLDASIKGPVRIVEVDGFDLQACCGTHPPSSGSVQCIAVIGFEKIKKMTKVYFVCGVRAVNRLYRTSKTMKFIGGKLNCPAECSDVERSLTRFLDEENALRKTLAENEKTLARYLAADIWSKSHTVLANGKSLCVTYVDPGKDMNALKAIAKSMLANPHSFAALLSVQQQQQTSPSSSNAATLVSVVIGSSEDENVDLRVTIKRIFARFNKAKGGGSAKWVQGGITLDDTTDLDAIRNVVTEELNKDINA